MAASAAVPTPAQSSFADSGSSFPAPSKNSVMQVRKRNGSLETADVNKIVRAVERCCEGLENLDPMRVASKTIGGLFNGATTKELDLLSIQTAASLISEEPEYSQPRRAPAARLNRQRSREPEHLFLLPIGNIRQTARPGFRRSGQIRHREFPQVERRDRRPRAPTSSSILACAPSTTAICSAIPRPAMCWKHRNNSSCASLAGSRATLPEAIEFYRLISAHEYMPSSPTLFNSGTRHAQMSSCYLLDSPADNLEAIYDKYKDVAHALEIRRRDRPGVSPRALARFVDPRHERPHQRRRAVAQDAGFVGRGGESGRQAQGRLLRVSRALARGHRGISGVARQHRGQRPAHLQPESGQLDSRSVHEAGGSRTSAGRCSIRRSSRTSRISLAKRLKRPTSKAEAKKLFVRQVKARELYARMMKMLAETGNGWMTFKDACNLKSNQTARSRRTSFTFRISARKSPRSARKQETAVCNLGSINLAKHVTGGAIRFREVGAARCGRR